MRHAIEAAAHIGILGVEGRVPHGHGNRRVPEVLRELGERHPRPREVHRRGVPVVGERVAHDPREPAGAIVFVLGLPAVHWEQPIRAFGWVSS